MTGTVANSATPPQGRERVCCNIFVEFVLANILKFSFEAIFSV
jgi:hypothetical protein